MCGFSIERGNMRRPKLTVNIARFRIGNGLQSSTVAFCCYLAQKSKVEKAKLYTSAGSFFVVVVFAMTNAFATNTQSVDANNNGKKAIVWFKNEILVKEKREENVNQ